MVSFTLISLYQNQICTYLLCESVCCDLLLRHSVSSTVATAPVSLAT